MPARLAFLDVLRGFALIVMVLNHTSRAARRRAGRLPALPGRPRAAQELAAEPPTRRPDAVPRLCAVAVDLPSAGRARPRLVVARRRRARTRRAVLPQPGRRGRRADAARAACRGRLALDAPHRLHA